MAEMHSMSIHLKVQENAPQRECGKVATVWVAPWLDQDDCCCWLVLCWVAFLGASCPVQRSCPKPKTASTSILRWRPPRLCLLWPCWQRMQRPNMVTTASGLRSWCHWPPWFSQWLALVPSSFILSRRMLSGAWCQGPSALRRRRKLGGSIPCLPMPRIPWMACWTQMTMRRA